MLVFSGSAEKQVFDPVHGVIHHFYQDHLGAHEGGPMNDLHTDAPRPMAGKPIEAYTPPEPEV